ncbi:unnamed protein product [Mytilus coruscus]|uniref:Uncharacterized protein n=1 Tax=Mytilus coruscus TaxID=42192 RepID=A0A6J8DVB0_MYTCO|nr:unnamed protein product [Mytilus coruscus]
MAREEVQELSSKEVDRLKSETMQKKAWAVSNEIRLRIDDARDPAGGYLHAYSVEQDELYLQYRKYQCRLLGQECDFCKNSQNSNLFGNELMPPVPRPYPDYEQLPQFHYLQHKDTPTSIDGVQRRHDDFQPRSNLKKLFSEGEISSFDDNEIEVFSKKFIVPKQMLRTIYCIWKHSNQTERKEQLIINKRDKMKGLKDMRSRTGLTCLKIIVLIN